MGEVCTLVLFIIIASPSLPPSLPLSSPQRIGVYNQHAADQLELSESPVEYLMVSRIIMIVEATGHQNEECPLFMYTLYITRRLYLGAFILCCCSPSLSPPPTRPSASSTWTTSSLGARWAATGWQATPTPSRSGTSPEDRRHAWCLLSCHSWSQTS